MRAREKEWKREENTELTSCPCTSKYPEPSPSSPGAPSTLQRFGTKAAHPDLQLPTPQPEVIDRSMPDYVSGPGVCRAQPSLYHLLDAIIQQVSVFVQHKIVRVPITAFKLPKLTFNISNTGRALQMIAPMRFCCRSQTLLIVAISKFAVPVSYPSGNAVEMA